MKHFIIKGPTKGVKGNIEKFIYPNFKIDTLFLPKNYPLLEDQKNIINFKSQILKFLFNFDTTAFFP